MKIIYLMEWEFCQEDGVIKKVLDQIETWEAMGHKVKLFVLTKCNQSIKTKNTNVYIKSIWNKIYNQKLYNDIKEESADIIYFRYSAYKPYLEKILKKYKVIVEINSDILTEKKLQRYHSIKDFLTYFYIKLTNKHLENISLGFVSVTYELKKTLSLNNNQRIIVIPNSISFLNNIESKIINKNRIIPNLVFIGSPNQEWHGLDKIIELAKKTEGKLNFDIIGFNSTKEIYSNIIFHGYLTKEKYKTIILNCDIGIGTLGLHRKNMDEACPLKVREYLLYGIPIIIGYTDTAFLNKEVETWILKLDNYENNVIDNIQKIIDFSYKNKNTLVCNKISNKYISSQILEEKRLNFFREVLNECN